MQSPSSSGTVADAQSGNWVDRHAPDWLKPYARLARWDRPIGFWLLFWPCGFALGLAAVANPAAGFDWRALLLCFIGAVAMRGAGCTFNDIVDRDIDDKVERTRSRPIPSGQVTVINAVIFMALQGLVGLAVLVQFNWFTIVAGIASLVLVAIYPFMKRITWWPQAWLGLTFNWGVLVGWLAVAPPSLPMLLLYGAGVFWTLGYDTIYALQDIEDDAFAGIKSSARALGARARTGVGVFYAAAVALAAAALWLLNPQWPALLALVPAAAHLAWQVVQLRDHDAARALVLFRSNRLTGSLLFAACAVVGWA